MNLLTYSVLTVTVLVNLPFLIHIIRHLPRPVLDYPISYYRARRWFRLNRTGLIQTFRQDVVPCLILGVCLTAFIKLVWVLAANGYIWW